ncbi:hypothetical protein KEM54_006900 [Ascosphaera aggregata]|nr:hypothetical protein KEM54_006900 [Ascosphaera aggregata]
MAEYGVISSRVLASVSLQFKRKRDWKRMWDGKSIGIEAENTSISSRRGLRKAAHRNVETIILMAAEAEYSYSPSFGAELKVSLGIEWLDEIQSFYRERSAIEKEFSQKIIQLCRRYHERKAKKSSTLSVGETPTMTPGSLEAASLTTWTTQLTAVEAAAQERDKYAADLITKVADPLRWHAIRFEDLRKAHAEYAGKLEKERDSSYADLRKTKGKYDAVCQEVENKRKKAEAAHDHGKTKAQAAFQQQIEEMNNMKNTYLIAINVTNKLKERYYNEYVPEVLDGLQELNEIRVAAVNDFWLKAMNLEKNTLQKQSDQVAHVISEIPRNNPKLDSMLFAQHNVPAFAEPPDIPFEPSPVWHDDAVMVTDEVAKIFLMNLLARSKGSMNQLKADADRKRVEVEKQKEARLNVRSGKIKGNEVDVVHSLFGMEEDLHTLDRKLLACAVETAVITTTVGDLSKGAQRHNFRSQTFKIPTNCDLCGERIWGLSAKGFDCKDCGYTCHSKCEMKVPASCPGEMSKEDKKKLKATRQESAGMRNLTITSSNGDLSTLNGSSENVESRLTRQNTMTSLSSRTSATGLNRNTSGSNAIDEVISESAGAGDSIGRGSTSTRKSILAPPPAHYVETPAESPFSVPTGKMRYSFTASDAEEISIVSGAELTVIEPDDGSGWTRVQVGASTGLVPTSYIDLTSRPANQLRPASNRSNGSSVSVAASSYSIGALAGKRRGPAVAPRRGAKKLQYVIAMYDYEARTDAEFSFREGDKFVLVNRDSGNGWSDVEKDGVVKSVPANYVELC